MSITDVDKINQDRGSPRPNTHDVLPNRPNYGTLSTQYVGNASEITGFLKMQNQSILANDGTVPRAIYGYNAALGEWGFFLTKAGVDVTTNTNLADFIFNSQQDVYKIVKSGTGSSPAISAGSHSNYYSYSAVNDYAHGLTYTPSIDAYISNIYGGGENLPLPWSGVAPGLSGAAYAYWSNISVGVDATNVYVYTNLLVFGTGVSFPSYTVNWNLLQESVP